MSSGLSQAEIDALLRGEPLPSEGEPSPEAGAEQAAADPAPAAEPEVSSVEAPEAAVEPAPAESAPEPSGDLSFINSLPGTEGILSDIEIDTLGEIGNISMGTAATTLFTLLSHKVDITTPKVTLTSMRAISEQYPMPFVAVEVQYTEGLEGTNILFLRENDVKIITDLLMGGDGTNTSADLTELHLSAISEVMNQMVGSSSTSLAKLMGLSIDISPPRAFQVNLPADASSVYSDLDEIFVRISFQMVVEGLINSEIMQVMPVNFAKSQVGNLLGGGAASAAGIGADPAPAAAPPPPPQQQQQQAPPPPPQYQQPMQEQPQYAPPPPQYQQPPYPYPPQPAYPPQYPYPPQDPYGGYPPQAPPPHQMVDVRAASFSSFDSSGPSAGFGGENMDLLMDVPLSVSVELGKSSKFIKEILDFNVGTIVVLDKMAGELVDIVVNGKLIAKGEVVVIDDNYGARITDIVSPSKRIGPGK